MRLLALIFVLLLFPSTSWAERRGRRAERELSASDVREIVRDAVAESLPEDVELSSVRWSRPLRVPRGPVDARAHVEGDEPIRGRMRARVELRVRDQLAATIRVQVAVRDLRLVVVARRELRPGQRITRRDIELREPPAGMRARRPLRAERDALGLSVSRITRAGDVLDESAVRPPSAVRRGDRVRLISRVGGVLVATVGEPLEDGSAGEVIRVVCVPSRRTVEARVTGSGVVEVTR